jgi:hypothetical protein
VPAPQYVHLQFPYRSPKQRLWRGIWVALACLGVAGVGAAMMVPLSPRKSDAAMAPVDQVSRAEGIPAVSPIAYAAVDPQTASEHGARGIAGKPFCLGPSPSDGNCVSFELPKVRMVRVPTLRASSVGHQGNSAKPGTTANSKATEPDKRIAETKKAQRWAHRQNPRRNQPRGDVRVADWAARGYAQGDYGRQGYSRNFW